MEPLINSAAHLAVPFAISAACRFLDLPLGLASPFKWGSAPFDGGLRPVLTENSPQESFRALEPSKPSKSAIASVVTAVKLPAKIHSPADHLI